MPKWLRQLIGFGGPLLVGLVNLAHPVHFEPTSVYHTIVDRVDWWIALHIINLMGFALLGLTVFLLVQDRSGIAATISKIAIAIYVPFYIGFVRCVDWHRHGDTGETGQPLDNRSLMHFGAVGWHMRSR
jgi:hypothetical protein